MTKTIRNLYLFPDGNVNMNSIAHLTGSFTSHLVKRIWEQSGHNEQALDRLFELLEQMNDTGREAEIMEWLQVLCGVLGHIYSDEILRATSDPQIRTAFILSFLSDFDDTLLDLTS